MDCNDYEHLITDYLENKCTPAQRRQMELHFSECEKCSLLAEQEKLIMKELIGISIQTCPDEIIDNVMKSIPCQPASLKGRILSWLGHWSSMRYRTVSLAGSFAIAALLLCLYFPAHERQTMETTAYTPEEIKEATTEVRLALAYFAVYSHKTETALKKLDFTEPVIRPVEKEFKKALGKIPYI